MPETMLTSDQLATLLPCPPPYLMLDRAAVDAAAGRGRGLKLMSVNEPFFAGHFPNNPITPGVLQVEAIYQLAELVAQQAGRLPAGVPCLRAVTKVKFRAPLRPGDRCLVDAELGAPHELGICCRGTTSNEAGATCEAEFVLGGLDPTRLGPPATLLPATSLAIPPGGETMDVAGIMAAIPHRFPFLLVDRIVSLRDQGEGGHIIGVKNVTGNEGCFEGPAGRRSWLVPSLQLEIAAQVGCVYALSRPAFAGRFAYFMSIDNAHFLRPVLVGDQLLVDVEMSFVRGRFGRGVGKLYVGGDLVSDVTLKFAIVSPSEEAPR